MRKTIDRLLLAAVMFTATAVTSCVSDETILDGPEPTGNGNELLLRLKTPGSFATPATRGLTFAQENAVNNVWVMAVDGANVVAMAKGYDTDFDTNDDYDGSAADPDDNSATGTFSVVLPNSLNGKTIKLVVLANAEDILEGTGYIEFVEGKFVPVASVLPMSYTGTSSVRASLIGHLGSGQDGEIDTSIPMWGEVTVPTLSPSVKPTTVDLVRAVARLDVGVGTPDYDETRGDYPWVWDGEDAEGNEIPFELTGVEVNSRTNLYYLIPELDAEGDPILSQKIDTPPMPTQTTYAGTDVITSGDYTTQKIYLPESAAKVNLANPTMDDADHADRTYIIVEGIYTGDNSANTTPTFYRLDFADEDENLLDVLRNHLYRFNITNVDGPGYTDIDDARTSRPMNMTADLVEIDEGASGYAVFDDEYYLSVDPVEFMLQAVAGSSTFTLQTDHPDWTAKVWANEDGTGAAAWLKINTPSVTPSDEASGNDNNELPQDLTATVETNPSKTAERSAWIIFTAGRMTIKVKVTQKRDIFPGILAAPGVIGYIKGTNILTIRGSKEFAGSPVMENNGAGPNALATGQPLENATVYVAYFKFGSLVATASEYHSTTFNAADDVVATPSEWSGTVTTWASIPHVTLGANQELMVNGVSQGKVSAAQATGDPCIYWADKYGWGDNWKLPTGNSWFKEGGSPFGTANVTGTPWSATGGYGPGAGWISKGTSGLPIAGAVGGKSATAGDHDWSMFLPAAEGRINTDGTLNPQGLNGNYWTSTSSNNGASWLYVNDEEVYPAPITYFDFGMSVRCVQPPILKVPNAPTPFYDGTTVQKILVESNGSWEVSENVGWLEIVAGTEEGSGIETFSLRATPDMVNERPASYYAPGKVTVTNGITTVEINVEFLFGGYDDILYFDANDNNRLKIGKWAPAGVDALRTGTYNAITAVDQLAFFKFGSVIGFTGANVNWNTDYIRFNPSQYSVGVGNQITDFVNAASRTADNQWGVGFPRPELANKLPNIPGYDPAVDGSVTDISSPNYNNYDNIKVGKGDPCQLVGLTADEIKVAGAAGFQSSLNSRPDDYKDWRMPTVRENVSFGGETDPKWGDWVTWEPGPDIYDDMEIPGTYAPFYDYWDARFSPPVGKFPSQWQGGYRDHGSQILPVIGFRHANFNGAMNWTDPNPTDNSGFDESFYSVNIYGSYWSSSVDISDEDTAWEYAYTVSIYDAKTVLEDSVPFSSGFMVRCVRDR